MLASQSAAWFCRRGCPSRAHTRQGLRNGCPEERAPRVLAIIPTDGPTRSEYKRCRGPKPNQGRHVLRTRTGRRPCLTYVRKYARLARKGRQALRSKASLRLKPCFVIQGDSRRLICIYIYIYIEAPTVATNILTPFFGTFACLGSESTAVGDVVEPLVKSRSASRRRLLRPAPPGPRAETFRRAVSIIGATVGNLI